MERGVTVILAVIIACEIGFWVFVAAGLVARYPMRLKRLGAVLLAMTPVVDLVLLGFVALDLSRGGHASFGHGLAALYIGLSVAHGHAMIRWADVCFAHRFNSGPAPCRPVGGEYAALWWWGECAGRPSLMESSGCCAGWRPQGLT